MEPEIAQIQNIAKHNARIAIIISTHLGHSETPKTGKRAINPINVKMSKPTIHAITGKSINHNKIGRYTFFIKPLSNNIHLLYFSYFVILSFAFCLNALYSVYAVIVSYNRITVNDAIDFMTEKSLSKSEKTDKFYKSASRRRIFFGNTIC